MIVVRRTTRGFLEPCYMRNVAMICRSIILAFFVVALCFTLQGNSIAQGNVTRIFSLAWSPDGLTLAMSGIFDGERAVRLFDSNGALIQQHISNDGLRGLVWRPDSTQLAVARGKIWDITTGSLILNQPPGTPTNVDALAWNPANFGQIASITQDKVLIFDATTGQTTSTLDIDAGHPDAITGFGWSLDGATIYTVTTNDVIRTWNTATGSLGSQFELSFGAGPAAMSHDATRIAIAGNDGVYIHNLTDGSLALALQSFSSPLSRSPVGHLEWSPDDTKIVGVDNIGIHEWDVHSGNLRQSIAHNVSNWVSEAVSYRSDGALTYIGETFNVLVGPTADAGIDQTLTDSDNSGSEAVTLDGSGSSDSDGQIDSYSWQENGVEIATGVNPTVDLLVGTHTITLVVTDDDGATGSDEVVITVNAPTNKSPTSSPIC